MPPIAPYLNRRRGSAAVAPASPAPEQYQTFDDPLTRMRQRIAEGAGQVRGYQQPVSSPTTPSGGGGGNRVVGGPAISGWAEATGRRYRTNPSGSVTMMDRPGGPGVAPVTPGGPIPDMNPGHVTELLQGAINRTGGGAGGGGMLGQLGDVLQGDTVGLQAAADRQQKRNQDQIDSYGQYVKGINDRVTDPAERGASMLEGEAAALRGTGDQAVADYRQRADKVMGSLDQDLKGVFGDAAKQEGAANEALGYAKRAEQAGESAVGGYDAAANENIANTIAGVDRRMQQQKKMIDAGLNPDGTMMSPQERQAAQRQLTFDSAQAVSGTVASIRDQQQTTLANLKVALGNIRLGSGQVALGAAGQFGEAGRLREGAAGMRAETGTRLAEGGLQAEGVRQAYRSLGAGLMQSAASMRNAAAATAVQLEGQGRGELAAMVRSNPDTFISRFNSLLTLFGVATAPGARNVPALQGVHA